MDSIRGTGPPYEAHRERSESCCFRRNNVRIKGVRACPLALWAVGQLPRRTTNAKLVTPKGELNVAPSPCVGYIFLFWAKQKDLHSQVLSKQKQQYIKSVLRGLLNLDYVSLARFGSFTKDICGLRLVVRFKYSVV